MARQKIEVKTGDKYGRLTIIKEVKNLNIKNVRFFLCSCECGNEKVIILNSLRSGDTKSCGCYRKEIVTERSITHGLWKQPLYNTWVNMKQRCYNPNFRDYINWGARGIKVCDRWINSFSNFLEDMGDRPDGKSLDRINNDGDYEPSNCRWATSKEQINNQRRFRKSAQS